MKKMMLVAVAMVVSAVAGLVVAAVTVGVDPKHEAPAATAGAAFVQTGQAGMVRTGDRYFKMNDDVRQARHACFDKARARHGVPAGDGTAYVTWWNTVPASTRNAWTADFNACKAANPARFPGDFHQVSEAEFYGN